MVIGLRIENLENVRSGGQDTGVCAMNARNLNRAVKGDYGIPVPFIGMGKWRE
jgi:hypothetical protein